MFYCEAFGEALHKAKAKMTVSEVLESIDKKVGLGVPIFLFGLEALGRGVSTRSSGRVATHLLVSLGPGHSLDNVIQSYGRGTGNVKSILRKNLGEDATIKILTIESDWKDSKAYVKYCQAKVEGKIVSRESKTLLATLSRRVGKRPKGRQQKKKNRSTFEYVSDDAVEAFTGTDDSIGWSGQDAVKAAAPSSIPKRKTFDDSCRVVTADANAKRQRTEL